MSKTFGYLKTTALGIVMVCMVFQLPLAARRGKTVEVHLREGGVVRGELVVVKADSLVVYHRASYEAKTIKVRDIAMVHVIRKSGWIQGLLLGGVGGFFLGTLFPEEPEAIGHPIQLTFPVGLLSGTILGAVAGTDKKYLLYSAAPERLREILKKLRRFARER